MATYEDDSELPFYGPLQNVVPSSEDLVPPAFVHEIESWKPVVGVDINSNGGIISNDKFKGACQNLFKPNRFYVNIAQLKQVATRLVGLWGSGSDMRRRVSISKQKISILCSFISWEIRIVPVRGKGKGAAHRIMANLDLEQPGLEVIKIRDSVGHKLSNPLILTPSVRAIKREEDCPYGSSDVQGIRTENNANKHEKSPRTVTPTVGTEGKKVGPSGQRKRTRDEFQSARRESGVKSAVCTDPKKDRSLGITAGAHRRGDPCINQTNKPTRKPQYEQAKAGKGVREAPVPASAYKKFNRDIEIVSSEGDRFPTRKTLLAAASPTLKALMEADVACSAIHMTYPSKVVRAAMTAIYSNEHLDEEVLENHPESCLSLASDYQLIRFQRVLHQALLGKLSIGNLKMALLEAEKTKDMTFKQGCLKFVQQHARTVLKDRSMIRLATQKPGLWDELVEASLSENCPSEQAEEEKRKSSHKNADYVDAGRRSTTERTPFNTDMNGSKGAAGANPKRRKRCGICDNCNQDDCGVCRQCIDMKKFGGGGTLKQACAQRRSVCLAWNAP